MCACGCGNTGKQTLPTPQASDGPNTYTVTGMTCGHCVASVTEEVSGIEGVSNVNVDLASGRLTFDSEAPVNRETVEAAVQEAGYALA